MYCLNALIQLLTCRDILPSALCRVTTLDEARALTCDNRPTIGP
jgi:hypothetical protein